jgi:DNA-binding transcriptional regulator LsrR (DeoR family)
LDDEEDGLVKRQSWRTQAEIAAQMGTVVDVINRILQKFERERIIEISREHFRILDRNRLRKIIQKAD